MDHGADCINTGLSTMAYFQIINPDLIWIYLSFFFLYQIFFLVILEEYYFGSLDFPMFNAVNEGTTSTFFILLIGVFAGNDIYQKDIIWGLNLYQCILIGLIFLIILQNIWILIKLFRNYDCKDIILKNVLFAYISLSYILVVILSQNQVVRLNAKIILYIYTILFSRIIISIMICHIFDSNFNQLQVFPIFISTTLIGIALIEKFILDRKFYIFIYN